MEGIRRKIKSSQQYGENMSFPHLRTSINKVTVRKEDIFISYALFIKFHYRSRYLHLLANYPIRSPV